jgi:iron-sulfur cluster assembly protein
MNLTENDMPRAKRAPLPMMNFTDNALARLQEIISESDSGVIGLRLSLKKGGCAGNEYVLEQVKERKAGDEILSAGNGAEVHLSPDALLFVLGTTMDYKIEKFKEEFIFINPNQTDACGCGESVKLTKADPGLYGVSAPSSSV